MTGNQLQENVKAFSYYYHLEENYGIEQASVYLECAQDDFFEVQDSRMANLVHTYAECFKVSFADARDAMFSAMYDFDYENGN